MSKALRIPTNSNELTEYLQKLFESTQKRGIRLFMCAGYSHMINQDIVFGNPSLYSDRWEFTEFIGQFEDWLDFSYNLVNHWLGEKEANRYNEILAEWLLNHKPRTDIKKMGLEPIKEMDGE